MSRAPLAANKSSPNLKAFSLAELFLLLTLVALLLPLAARSWLGMLIALHAAPALAITLWYRDKWMRMGQPLTPLELAASFASSFGGALLASIACAYALFTALESLSFPFWREPLVALLGAAPAIFAAVWVLRQFLHAAWTLPRRQWILDRRLPTLLDRVLRFGRCFVLMSGAILCANVLVIGVDALYAAVNQPRETADAYLLSLIVRCVTLYGGGWLGYCVLRGNLRESAALPA